MAGAPPTSQFHIPKIQPGNSNFQIKSTHSMGPTVQTVQPSQWDLASPGIQPMKTSNVPKVAFLATGIGALAGASKADAANQSAGGGALRGGLGALAGEAVGGGLGGGVGGRKGRIVGSVLGGLLGYQALTRKYNKTASVYSYGCHTALEKLGMVGYLEAFKNLGRSIRIGWLGDSMAAGKGYTGLGGAYRNATSNVRSLMRHSPGTAAGMIGTGAALGGGAAALGANAMFGGQPQQQKVAFLGAAMAGARALGGRAIGAMGMGAGKGLLSNTMGAATALGTANEAKGLWNQARANLPSGV